MLVTTKHIVEGVLRLVNKQFGRPVVERSHDRRSNDTCGGFVVGFIPKIKIRQYNRY